MKTDLECVLHRRLQKRLGQAIKTFELIEKGDRILLGLSGGKDSLSLLDLLGERMLHSNGYFCLEAVHVRMKKHTLRNRCAIFERSVQQVAYPLACY